MDYLLVEKLFHVELHEPLAGPGTIPEAFVHHLWKSRLFSQHTLHTVQGEPITVIHPGDPQPHAGPDFFHARIRTSDVLWAGAVEIHLTSADWERHGHHNDARYNAVVLHVSLFADARTGKLRRADGSLLPEVVLYRYLQAPIRRLLHAYYTSGSSRLYCQGLVEKKMDSAVIRQWIQEQGKERMRQKARFLAEAMEAHTPEEALYIALFTGLGYEPNKQAMQSLALAVPFTLAREITNRTDREALFFGQAGLLPAAEEIVDKEVADYVADLHARYQKWNRLRELPPSMESVQWRWGKLRPTNFPTLRIAQGTGWFDPGGVLHQDVLGPLLEGQMPRSASDFYAVLCRPLPDFWCHHVRFAPAASAGVRHGPGRQRARMLVLNVLIPFLLARGFEEAALWELIRAWKSSSDRITRKFHASGIQPASALENQGLHHVYSHYCRSLRCLDCAIGQRILRGEQGREGT